MVSVLIPSPVSPGQHVRVSWFGVVIVPQATLTLVSNKTGQLAEVAKTARGYYTWQAPDDYPLGLSAVRLYSSLNGASTLLASCIFTVQ